MFLGKEVYTGNLRKCGHAGKVRSEDFFCIFSYAGTGKGSAIVKAMYVHPWFLMWLPFSALVSLVYVVLVRNARRKLNEDDVRGKNIINSASSISSKPGERWGEVVWFVQLRSDTAFLNALFANVR